MAEQKQRPAALVTGGAIRLGKANALALAEAGYDIALHYFSSEREAMLTQSEIESLGVRCIPFRLNLAKVCDYAAFMTEVHTKFPDLCVLVNSASGYIQANISNSTQEQFDQLFAINLRAPFFLSQAFAACIGRGNIINIIDNKIGFNQFKYAAYLLTKKALADFTYIAALEFAPNIRVNGVAPGVTLPAPSRSEEYLNWRIQGIPVKHKGDVHHITDAILFLLKNEFVNGHVIVVDGGENINNTGQNAGEYDQNKV